MKRQSEDSAMVNYNILVLIVNLIFKFAFLGLDIFETRYFLPNCCFVKESFLKKMTFVTIGGVEGGLSRTNKNNCQPIVNCTISGQANLSSAKL